MSGGVGGWRGAIPMTRPDLGRPPHIAPKNAGYLSQADTRLPDLVKLPRHAAALYNERDYATPHADFPSRQRPPDGAECDPRRITQQTRPPGVVPRPGIRHVHSLVGGQPNRRGDFAFAGRRG